MRKGTEENLLTKITEVYGESFTETTPAAKQRGIESLKALAKTAVKDRDFVLGHYTLAWAYMLTRQYGKARFTFNKVLARQPEYAPAMRGLKKAEEMEKKVVAAA